MIKCKNGCMAACDFCIYFDGDLKCCNLHQVDTTEGDFCEDYHCKNAHK